MNKNELRTMTIGINNLLSEYIQLHDSLLKNQETLSSLMNSIFKLFRLSIMENPLKNSLENDYQDSYSATELLLSKFDVKHQELKTLSRKSDDQGLVNYYDCLLGYFNALHETVRILHVRQGMRLVIQKGEKLSWSEYKSVEKNYKTNIKKHLILGRELNKMTHLVFN